MWSGKMCVYGYIDLLLTTVKGVLQLYLGTMEVLLLLEDLLRHLNRLLVLPIVNSIWVDTREVRIIRNKPLGRMIPHVELADQSCLLLL